MANSNGTCEVKNCATTASSNVQVKGQQRKVGLCDHHRKFNNSLALKDGTAFHPGTGELKQN